MRHRVLGGARLAGSTIKATMIIITTGAEARARRWAVHSFVIRALRGRDYCESAVDAYYPRLLCDCAVSRCTVALGKVSDARPMHFPEATMS
jgi:hypothetical protein